MLVAMQPTLKKKKKKIHLIVMIGIPVFPTLVFVGTRSHDKIGAVVRLTHVYWRYIKCSFQVPKCGCVVIEQT